MSEEEITGLKETFQAMDTDNSGTITFEELKGGLRRAGSTLNDQEIRELMDAVGGPWLAWGLFLAGTGYSGPGLPPAQGLLSTVAHGLLFTVAQGLLLTVAQGLASTVTQGPLSTPACV